MGFTFNPSSFSIGNLNTNVPYVLFTADRSDSDSDSDPTPTPTPTTDLFHPTPTRRRPDADSNADSNAVGLSVQRGQLWRRENAGFQVMVARSGDTWQTLRDYRRNSERAW